MSKVQRIGAVFVALTIATTLVGCGASGGDEKADKGPDTTTTAKPKDDDGTTTTTEAKIDEAAAKAAADDFAKALDDASAASPELKDLKTAGLAKDVSEMKAQIRETRDADFQLDKDIRAIDFPEPALEARNAYLEANTDVIGGWDAMASVLDADELFSELRAVYRLFVPRTVAGREIRTILGALNDDEVGTGDPAPEPEGKVVLEDDFSDPTSGWTESEKEQSTMGYGDGVYSIQMLTNEWTQVSDSRLEGEAQDPALEELASVSVEVDAAKVESRKGDGDSEGYIGVACYVDTSDFAGYFAAVDTNGTYEILKGTQADGFVSLGFGRGDFVEVGSGADAGLASNHVRLDCSPEGDGVRLTMYVNDVQAATALDEDDPLTAGPIALFAQNAYEGCCVAAEFDDLTIRDLS